MCLGKVLVKGKFGIFKGKRQSCVFKCYEQGRGGMVGTGQNYRGSKGKSHTAFWIMLRILNFIQRTMKSYRRFSRKKVTCLHSHINNFFVSGHYVDSRLEMTLAIYIKFQKAVLFGIQLHSYEFILTKSFDKSRKSGKT